MHGTLQQGWRGEGLRLSPGSILDAGGTRRERCRGTGHQGTNPRRPVRGHPVLTCHAHANNDLMVVAVGATCRWAHRVVVYITYIYYSPVACAPYCLLEVGSRAQHTRQQATCRTAREQHFLRKLCTLNQCLSCVTLLPGPWCPRDMERTAWHWWHGVKPWFNGGYGHCPLDIDTALITLIHGYRIQQGVSCG